MSARIVVAFAIFVALAGCAPQPARPPAVVAAEPTAFDAEYEQALQRGERVFRIDGPSSLIVLEVRRAGSLAQFGHDHVVASHDASGFVAPDRGRADLRVRLDRLVVDEPELREAAGFQTRPSAEDIAGTRANMLGPVLEADRFPEAIVRVDWRSGDTASVAFTLHGVTHSQRVPIDVVIRDDALQASGRCVLRQSEFGIAPFSIFGGAIRVDDAVAVRFVIRARPPAL